MRHKPLAKIELLRRRKKRIRKKIDGTAERPRLSVFRSARHVYAQVIDDDKQQTLAMIRSFGKDASGRANVAKCKELGGKLATLCQQKNIATVVFDRNGFAYHGRIKALAEGVREGGVHF